MGKGYAMALTALVLCPLGPRCARGDDQALLEFVRDAHRSTRESIRSCSCRVQFKLDFLNSKATRPKEQNCSGRFWYSPDSVRGKVSDSGQEYDYVWNNSIYQEIVRGTSENQSTMGAGRRRAASRYKPRCDAWIRGLLALNVPGTIEYVTFEQLVDRATRVTGVTREKTKKGELVKVRLLFDQQPKASSASWTVDVTFDSTVNYLVRTVDYTPTKGDGSRKEEVLQFRECTPGIFFPERILGESIRKGALDNRHNTTIAEIQINEPLPDGVFRLRYPNGIRFTDDIRGVQYLVNAQGNPITKEEPILGGGNRIIPPAPLGQTDALASGRETQEEPLSWSRWILPVSLGVLAIGLSAVLMRRRMRRAH